VAAAAAGRVIRADTNYREMTVSEYERLIEQSMRTGGTPDEVLDRLAGRQVIIEHGNGLQTVYMHLDSIEPGITAGEIVQAGDLIGTVGVTGTQGEAEPGTALPHLHFEIWIDDHYLGQGVTIREAMWWLEQVFGE
jgi:murein DD-endopeptidase MepM/ murein hydrolase activator NlpD